VADPEIVPTDHGLPALGPVALAVAYTLLVDWVTETPPVVPQ